MDLPGVEAPIANPRVYPWLVRGSAVVVVAIAASALIGWIFDVELLTRWRPRFYPMLPLTVTGHLLAGAVLGLVESPHPGRRERRAGRLLAVILAAVGAVTLAQYVLGVDLGLGRLLFPESVRAAGGPKAGQPAFNSGTGFLAGGIAVLLLLGPARRRHALAAQLLGLVVLLVGMVALIGYAFAVEELYTVGPYTPMSLPSAVAFLVTAVGILAARPDQGLMEVITADDTGGRAARRLLPSAFLVTFLLGLFRVVGREAGLFGARYGLTVVVVASTVLLVAVILWNAWIVHRSDAVRARQTARLDLERRRLRAVLDTLPVGVAVADATGRLVLFNNALRTIWGRGVPLAERLTEYDQYKAWWPGTGRRVRAEEWSMARAILEGEVPPPQEVDIESFDGKRKTILSYGRPIRNAAGRLTGGVVAVLDVTERRRAELERERARAEAERRAREEEALRVATGAVIAAFTVEEVVHRIADSALTATGADAALVERVDMDRGEAVVIGVAGERGLARGARLRYSGSLMERVILDREPVVIEDVMAESHVSDLLRRAFGPGAALAVPMMEPGEPLGALILLREPGRPIFGPDDVDRAETFAGLASLAFRKVHLLEESERRREELRRVLESQSRLVRGFSHDVKNPLAAVDGRLALLEQGVREALTEAQRAEVARARRSLSTALRLIDSLVDFARAEAGQLEIDRRPTDIGDVAREIVEEQRPAAHAKRLGLHIDVAAGLDPIRSDPDRVRQILGNLVSNAIKYTDDGEVAIRVVEREGPSTPGPGRWLAVDVADTGPGIPEDKQEDIFGEFTRLEPGADEGAGLGLAISRRLARLLGGDITVQSEVGRGTTFTLWLPCGDGPLHRVRAA